MIWPKSQSSYKNIAKQIISPLASVSFLHVPLPSSGSPPLQPPKTPQVSSPENFQHFSFSKLVQHYLQICLPHDLDADGCMAQGNKQDSPWKLLFSQVLSTWDVGQSQPAFEIPIKKLQKLLRTSKWHTDLITFWVQCY